MGEEHFQAGGVLLADSPAYIMREADEKAAIYLRRMEYISLIEPRQQGKTSLLYHLRGQFSSQGYTFATRDLMANKPTVASLTEWYASLGKWLVRQLTFIPPDQRPTLPTGSTSLEDFFAEIAERAEVAGQKVVIVLDEVGAMPPELATDFFSVIRSIYTSRQSFSFWRYLTFIIAGTFNPKELIRDSSVSDFNIDQRIYLTDFTLQQVEQLVSHMNLSEALTKAIAKHVLYWTDGQPYLSQQLCLYLARHKDAASLATVEALAHRAVKHLITDDAHHHLERIKNLCAEQELLAYVRRITCPPQARLSTGLNDKHFRLSYLLGVIKADHDGRCQVRNRIYELAMREIEETHLSQRVEPKGQRIREQVFISYSHKDKKWLGDLQNMLAPLVRDEKVKLWADTQIEPGAEWQEEIAGALMVAKVAVLLVTSNFLASNFLTKHELLPLLEAAKHEGLTILWVAVGHSLYAETEIVHYQSVNDPTRPLDSLSRTERNKEWVSICEKIKKAIGVK
ncbi:MAG TPA: AAA-like domain-containing protein [Ktedonobacteraceae bacterium]|nr:AAA-like domain-containing protein [Ktedonobacteraceae bacterium]